MPIRAGPWRNPVDARAGSTREPAPTGPLREPRLTGDCDQVAAPGALHGTSNEVPDSISRSKRLPEVPGSKPSPGLGGGDDPGGAPWRQAVPGPHSRRPRRAQACGRLLEHDSSHASCEGFFCFLADGMREPPRELSGPRGIPAAQARAWRGGACATRPRHQASRRSAPAARLPAPPRRGPDAAAGTGQRAPPGARQGQ